MRRLALLISLALAATLLPSVAITARAAGPIAVARDVEPVVITGALLPKWSRLAAEGTGKPYPSGAVDGVRDAHNGVLQVPPDSRIGVDTDDIVAFKYEDGKFIEIPVQVDERFPYFLANANSDFGFYSGTDRELTYEWDSEAWMKQFGECNAQFPTDADGNPITHVEDPVRTFDNDDEIAFMAGDAGGKAPAGTPGPPLTSAEREEIRLTDPTDPSNESFVYLFLRESGSTFTAANGYVDYQRDANADQWIDGETFADSDPQKVGTSNRGYGPNISGTVCTDDPDTPEVETIRQVDDRFPRDGVTVSTDSYRWRATGRWMLRGMQVARPDGSGYGPDLVDRWKGRAFQQAPDSSISVVGFEDEQVNWEGNSALLGELQGPVRAIREIWGADSGTNVTKTETFYRDSIVYRYRVRVHPIPPDGLYTSWDYNRGVATTYYNEMLVETRGGGVAIDGENDEVYGNVDRVDGAPCPKEDIDDNEVTQEIPCIDNAYFDAPDATFTKPVSFFNWEQVSGNGQDGSLVYMFQMNNPQSLENPLVVPYYRDDACLDDGTGDDPVQRPWPGESYRWMRENGHSEYPDEPDCFKRQGAYGSHGVHYFVTHDTDNATAPVPVNEIDGQQWQWAVPTDAAEGQAGPPVGDQYANTAKAPLIASSSSSSSMPGKFTTQLEILEPRRGQTTDDSTLRARLTTEDGSPLDEEDIDFAFDGQDLGRAQTDTNGIATIPLSLSGEARSVNATAEFAGDDNHSTSSASAPYAINHEGTSLSLKLTKVTRGIRAKATLADRDSGQPVAGRRVKFVLNNKKTMSATTNSSGVATVVFVTTRNRRHRVAANFAGDRVYLKARAARYI